MSEPMTAEERDHARRTAEALASLEAKWDAVVVAAVRHGWEEGETLPEFIDWLAARWHREAAEVSRLAAERERDAAAAHEVIQAMQKANDEALAALAAENERLREENGHLKSDAKVARIEMEAAVKFADECKTHNHTQAATIERLRAALAPFEIQVSEAKLNELHEVSCGGWHRGDMKPPRKE